MFYSKTMSIVLEQTLHFISSICLFLDNDYGTIIPQALFSKYLVEHECVKSYISLNMNGLKITNDVL
jgi:hypothetical protein